jgi:hypothetical protein
MKRGLLFLTACATLGNEGLGDRDLPSANVGPFRKLESKEVRGVAPFVLEDRFAQYREPTALALNADPASTRVILYAVAKRNGKDVIVRSRADDARSFFGSSGHGREPPIVLEEAEPVSGPSALRMGDEVFLYYATSAGIRLARSSDGLVFRKEAQPVLGEGKAPSVARFPDGTLHMLYAAPGGIFEADSIDGLTWNKLGLVLAPTPGTFDAAEVTDPCLLPRTTPAERLHVRVLYTGYDAARNSVIGFAARYGSGGLVKNAGPVYSAQKHEAAPALFEWSGGAMLFVHQDKSIDQTTNVPAIAGAFAPPTLTLPAPLDYPEDP